MFYAFLVKVENTYVGYTIFYKTYSSMLAKQTLQLEDIYINEKYRRSGIGQKLFDYVLKKSVEMDCERVDWIVLSWNKPAINFYEKNNAKKLDWLFCRLTKEEIRNKFSKA